MARTTADKVIALYNGATTDGERTAARAAAQRLYNAGKLTGPLRAKIECGFADEIVDAMRSLWDDKRNGYRRDIFTPSIRWELSGYDHKELRRALALTESRIRRGHVRGVYHGPKINDIESDLKMLSCFAWILKQAHRDSFFGEFGEYPN